LCRRDLAARQDDDRRNAGGCRVCRERGGRVACGCAADRAHARALRDHLLDGRHEHRHAEILERARVRRAALLDPQMLDADPGAEPRGGQKRRAAFVHRHDMLVADARGDPLLLAPDARAVGPRSAPVARFEQLFPLGGRSRGERVEVVFHLEQIAARGTAGQPRVERVRSAAARRAAECGAERHAWTSAAPLPRSTGMASGGETWKSNPAIRAMAARTACDGASSRLTMNGRADAGKPGSCRMASMLMSWAAKTAASAAMMPGRSRTVKRT